MNGPTATRPLGIKYLGIMPPEGYGVAAKRAVLGLAGAGVPVTFTALLPSSDGVVATPGAARADAELAPLSDLAIPYDTVIVHVQPEHWGALAAAEPGKRIIGLTTWETDRLPPSWPAAMEPAERIIVHCNWNRDVFVASGVKQPVHVVPCIAVAPEMIRPPTAFGRSRPFVINAVGVWCSRKNIEGVVRTYLRAFGLRDHTELVLKTTPRDLTRLVRGRYLVDVRASVALVRLQTRSLARIRIHTGTLSEAEMAAIQARGDAYLAMSHGEGWGLGACDAAARGCPVISPVHGGARDFLGDAHPFAVRWHEVPVTPKGYERSVFQPGQRWIEPDEAHGAALLRQIYKAPVPAFAAAARHAEAMRSQFHAGPATETLLRALA